MKSHRQVLPDCVTQQRPQVTDTDLITRYPRRDVAGHRRPHAAQTGGHPRGRRGWRSPRLADPGVLGVSVTVDADRHRDRVYLRRRRFPSGKHHSLVKAAEARLAVDTGADEIDMVIDVGAAVNGDYDEVFADILTVRGGHRAEKVLKVIIESAALLELSVRCGDAGVCGAVTAGADYVKTSTVFIRSAGRASRRSS